MTGDGGGIRVADRPLYGDHDEGTGNMTDEQLRRLRSALEGARRTASHTAGDVYLQGVRDGLSEALEILTGQP